MSAEDAPERRRRERREEDDQRFWRALKGERRITERRREMPATDAAADGPAASPEPARPTREEARRSALRNMLKAAEARQSRSGRTRRPVLAKGRRVVVVRGEHAGAAGVILDADYIESRVLLRLDGHEPPLWLPFSRVGAPDDATG